MSPKTGKICQRYFSEHRTLKQQLITTGKYHSNGLVDFFLNHISLNPDLAKIDSWSPVERMERIERRNTVEFACLAGGTLNDLERVADKFFSPKLLT